ncbi:MAG: endolytic transglycosylase MltG [Acidobacteria bacterium]|nr:endolytic transglycosylase MltG [Acidobacteriota bacterium]
MIRLVARVFLTALAGAMLWGLWLLADGTRPYLRSNAPILLEIPRGMSVREIARRLEEAGAIRSRITFLAFHSLRRGATLKAGEYSFDRPASTLEVLEKIRRGEIAYLALIIPEGYNRFEIADAVATLGFSAREEFLQATQDVGLIADMAPQAKDLEGYLFPDTYHFPRRTPPEQIVRAMVDRFRQVYSELKMPAAGEPVHEIVTMASLIEKETALSGERPLVAAVFYNRLRRSIALQCDPTVIYAAILENRYDGTIRQSNLNSPSPYNTYLHRGLPPGPIANPGKSSLAAALHPDAGDYLYFVANPDGGHTFSRTLAEHNQAVSFYRKSLGP